MHALTNSSAVSCSLIGAAASAVTLVEEWGVGDYSQAKGGPGGSKPLTATLTPRASTPKGTRLLRISAKGVHGGTVILYCQRPAWRASSTHIGLD
jgi:hypothetical protein